MQRVGIKLLNSDFVHYGVTYRGGLNVDPLPWNPSGSCEPGGLYFTLPRYAGNWVTRFTEHVADVVVPDGQPVWADDDSPTKWKAPQLVISNIRPLREFLMTLTDTDLSVFIRRAGMPVERYASCKTLYRRCLTMSFHSLYIPQYVDMNDWVFLVRKNPRVLLGRQCYFSETQIQRLVEANPVCLQFLETSAEVEPHINQAQRE